MPTLRQRDYRKGSMHKAGQLFGEGWLGESYRHMRRRDINLSVLRAFQASKFGAVFRYHFSSSRAKQTTSRSQKSLPKSVKSFVQVQAPRVSGKMVVNQVTSVLRSPVALEAPPTKADPARYGVKAWQIPRRLCSSRTRRPPQQILGWYQHIQNDKGC